MIKRKSEVHTIDSAFSMYELEKKAKGLTSKSIKNSRDAIELFVNETNLSMNDYLIVITKEKVIEWTTFMQLKDLSPASINAYLGRLRAFINWCINNEYLVFFKVQMVKGQEQKIKFFNSEELSVLMKRPPKDCEYVEYRTWVITAFILATGARAGTVVNIKREDINLKERYVIYTHLKNKSLATVPLSNNICRILNEYLKTWDINSEYLFTDMYGNQLSVSALRQALIKYCKRRNIKPRGPHSLRHSFAREWILKGGGAFQLQRMLTHSDLQMTKRYTNIFCADIQKDVDEFSALEFFVKSNKKIKRV